VCPPIGRDVNCPRDLSARHAGASIVEDVPKGDSNETWREHGFLRIQVISGPRPPALFRCRKPQRSPPRSRYHVERACIHLATGLTTGLFDPRLITAVQMATSAAGRTPPPILPSHLFFRRYDVTAREDPTEEAETIAIATTLVI
jgi:hypothetical protein